MACFARAEPAPPDAGRVIDRVVAVVEGQMISLSTLELEYAVALIAQGANPSAAVALDDRALAAGLDYVIAQRLAAREAEKLQAFAPDPAEVESALARFRGRFADYQSFD